MASAKVHYVRSARKQIKRGNEVLVEVGQEYWWWKFRYESKQVSLHDPGVTRMVVLTEHEEKCNEYTEFDADSLSKSDLESMKDDCESYRDEL